MVCMNEASFLKAEMGLRKLEECIISDSFLTTCLCLSLADSQALKFLCDPEEDKRREAGICPASCPSGEDMSLIKVH